MLAVLDVMEWKVPSSNGTLCHDRGFLGREIALEAYPTPVGIHWALLRLELFRTSVLMPLFTRDLDVASRISVSPFSRRYAPSFPREP